MKRSAESERGRRMTLIEWFMVVFAIVCLCAFCWEQGRLCGFDKGIEMGVGIGKKGRSDD